MATAGVVAVRVGLRGGARLEESPGLALVTGRMLVEGSRRRDWRQIAADAEARGASLTSAAGFESTRLAIDALAEDWQLAVDWAAELALESVFPTDRARWVAEQTAAELTALADEPEVRTGWAFMEQLYAPHPRARPIQGTEAGLEVVTGPACADFHRRSLASGVAIAVAGDVEEEAVRDRLEMRFAPLGDGPKGVGGAEPAAPVGTGERRRSVALPSVGQAHLFLGCRTARLSDPRLPALELLEVALGASGGLSGRIPHRVREAMGLAYTAEVRLAAGAGLDAGRTAIYVATAPANVEPAVEAVVRELETVRREGITGEELETARTYRLGREPFRRETAAQWASLMLDSELYGLPWDDPEWVRRRTLEVTGEDVRRAAELLPDAVSIRITVGSSAA